MKKLNLMPSEFKAAELMKLIRKVTILVVAIPVVYLLYLGGINYKMVKDIKDTQQKITVVEDLQKSIENTKIQIESRKAFLESLSKSEFELNNFVQFLNSEVSDDLNIISVDSKDRLTVTPQDIVVMTPEEETTEEDKDSSEKEAEKEEETTEEDKDSSEKEAEKGEETPPETLENNNPDYSDKMKLVLRGYSKNSVSIADFVYKLSLLDFIGDVKLTAIEEKLTPDGYSNVFEVVLDVK